MNFECSNKSSLVLATFLAALAAGPNVYAQPIPAIEASRKWEIIDNSFLVEEAFNQEPGVVQNIFTWTRARQGLWYGSVTQEWPVLDMRHQLSYSIPFTSTGDAAGVGDVLLNYRYQLREETAGGPAISPRLSMIVPTGREPDGLGAGTLGIDLNLPVSKQFGDGYVHANVGYTWLRDIQSTTHLAGSGIWRVAPMLNLLLEGVVAIGESVTVSPGFRRGWNFGERQLVVGLAIPITLVEGRSATAVLTYLSYELPFR